MEILPTSNEDAASDESVFPTTFNRPVIKMGRTLFYLITLGALILIYTRFSEISHLRYLFSNAGRGWIVAVIGSQLFSYYFTALNYREVLKMKGLLVPYYELFPVTFIIQFITQAIPTAGLSGQVFFIYYLKKYKLSFAEGMARAILEVLTLYTAYSITFVLAAVLLIRFGILARYPLVWIFIYVFIFFFCFAIFVFFAIQNKRRILWISWIADRLHRAFEQGMFSRIKKFKIVANHRQHVSQIIAACKDTVDIDFLKSRKSLFFGAVWWQFMILFCNALSLYLVGQAINNPIPFTVAFVVFTLSKLISMTSLVPGAFGIFEGGMIAVLLTFNVTAGAALAITILFRAFTFWLPMPVGWFLYGRYMNRLETSSQE